MQNDNAGIADNIKQLRDLIADAAALSGRSPDDIKLVAAAKTKPVDLIMQAVAAGVDAVGENRVQEMLEKRSKNAYDGAPLHFIGHLQSNKISKIVGVCDLIESVSSKTLVELIGKKASSLGIVQDILIEVNIGREPQKSGIMPEQTEEILYFASQTPGINVLGLMAIPPIIDKKVTTCYYYDTMFKLFVDMGAKKYDNVSVRLLSMGMSDSYIDAIHAGSNMVRIGSALFGRR
ncbi:MAG: YggS family pyridoxal phosphate-dependent enzyme [Oscillospiraceae bacterium]|nr:YggS family pyridoxal phosphate-dependent enzyme [Oscillospiraceae bacterium]